MTCCGAPGEAVVRLGEARELEHALGGEVAEDLGGRGAEREEEGDLGAGKRGTRVLQLLVQIHARRERQEHQEQAEAKEPASRAQSAPDSALWR
jgi:hypothetical protein